MFTRPQYLKKECTHEQYYSQFVSKYVYDTVKRCLGAGIKRSQDEHFNDIELRKWDHVGMLLKETIGRKIYEINGTGYSLSDLVCTVKEAARQIKKE